MFIKNNMDLVFSMKRSTNPKQGYTMKKTILLISTISLMSFSAIAGDQKIIKSCSADITMPGETLVVPSKFDVIRNKNSELSISLTQTVDGVTTTEIETATITKNKVRAGLIGELSEDETLNLSEQLIVHAMLMSEDPDFEGVYSTGIDLKKVRSAKIYVIGDANEMVTSAIVETRDENGKILGSFLGGFVVFPCK